MERSGLKAKVTAIARHKRFLISITQAGDPSGPQPLELDILHWSGAARRGEPDQCIKLRLAAIVLAASRACCSRSAILLAT